MEQNDSDEHPPEKKKASYDDSKQGGPEQVIRKEIAKAFPSRDDEKRLDEDIHRMIVTRENAEQLAENLASHLTSEIAGFAGMVKSSQQELRGFADTLKASTQNVRLVEEKVARLSRDVEDIRKGGTGHAVDERMSRLEALCNVLNEKLSRQEEICSALNGRVHSEHDELSKALNEKMSRQDELGRAIMAVLDDFKARMADYPTKSEIDPLWKEAETVILDGLNRQRGDLKALIAALDEDYKDGAISEKTYRETKEKTEEKLAVLEDKTKKFVEAAADRGRAVAERPAGPVTEKEKLAEAKMAELKKREERLALLEKKLDELARQASALSQSGSNRMTEFEKKLDAFSKQAASSDQASMGRIAEVDKKIETLQKQADSSVARRISEVEKKLDDSAKLAAGRMAEVEKKISELSQLAAGTSRLEARMGELGGRIEELRTALSSTDKRTMDFEARLREETGRRMPQPPEAREQQQQRRPAAGGGLLSRILGLEREGGEITPMAMAAPLPPPPVTAAEKVAEPEKIRIELEAPLAPAIMAPPYGPEEQKEKHLKAELESLEAMLGRLKGKQKDGGGHEGALSKLMGQRAELEGLLKMVEKKHAEGAIESLSYADIRQRTLERLSRINELLSIGQNK